MPICWLLRLTEHTCPAQMWPEQSKRQVCVRSTATLLCHFLNLTGRFLSPQRLTESNRAASALLRLCAFLASDAIPEELLTVGALIMLPCPAFRMLDSALRSSSIGGKIAR